MLYFTVDKYNNSPQKSFKISRTKFTLTFHLHLIGIYTYRILKRIKLRIMYKEENIVVFVIVKFCHKNGSSQKKVRTSKNVL